MLCFSVKEMDDMADISNKIVTEKNTLSLGKDDKTYDCVILTSTMTDGFRRHQLFTEFYSYHKVQHLPFQIPLYMY